MRRSSLDAAETESAQPSLVLGLDVGSAQVVAAVAEVTGDEPRVLGTGAVRCTGVRKGLVVDLDLTAEAIEQAVRTACEAGSVPEVRRTFLAVNGPHIQSVVGSAEVPVHRPSNGVTPEDVRRVLDSAAAVELPPGREVVQMVPRSYRLDGAEGVVAPIGLAGRSLFAEAHLITGETLPIRNFFTAARHAGLEVVDYQLALCASGEGVLTPEERQAGVLLLDIGADTTGVAVYDTGHLWHVAVIPVGSRHITTDIASLLQVPVVAAERLKIEHGWAAAEMAPDAQVELVTPSGQKVREVNERRLAEIIESRVQEILQLAARSVKRSGYAGLFPGGLVLTGGGARLRGMEELAADCLGLPARVGAPTDPLLEGPEFAAVAGLIRGGARHLREEAAAAAETEGQNTWGRVKNWLRGLFR